MLIVTSPKVHDATDTCVITIACPQAVGLRGSLFGDGTGLPYWVRVTAHVEGPEIHFGWPHVIRMQRPQAVRYAASPEGKQSPPDR